MKMQNMVPWSYIEDLAKKWKKEARLPGAASSGRDIESATLERCADEMLKELERWAGY